MKIKGLTDYVASTFVVTTDRILFKGRCLLQVTHLAAGSDAATLKIYDGVNTDGRLVMSLVAPANSSDSDGNGSGDLCESGVYADISGTSPTGIVRILPLDMSVEIDNE